MAFFQSDCIILKTYDLADADRIVVFFSRDHGVVRGVAHGVKRLKSKFGSALEQFTESRISFSHKENVELATVQGAELLRSSFSIAGNLNLVNELARMANILVEFSPPHSPDEKLYRMTAACFDAIMDDPSGYRSVGVYFDQWILKLAGFLPNWEICSKCRRQVATRAGLHINGSFESVCDVCRPMPGVWQLRASAVELISSVRTLSPRSFSANASENSEDVATLADIYGRMLDRLTGKGSLSLSG